MLARGTAFPRKKTEGERRSPAFPHNFTTVSRTVNDGHAIVQSRSHRRHPISDVARHVTLGRSEFVGEYNTADSMVRKTLENAITWYNKFSGGVDDSCSIRHYQISRDISTQNVVHVS